MKYCYKCNSSKSLSEFSKKNSTKDGLRANCKSCDQLYRIANKSKLKLYSDKYFSLEKNRLRKKETDKIRRFLNPDYIKIWRSNNVDKINACCMNRHATKLQRTPSWLTSEHFREIEQKYKLSNELTKKTNIPHEVDHIIPLKGKYMSGLHVPWNLRITTEEFNRSRPKNIKPFNGEIE